MNQKERDENHWLDDFNDFLKTPNHVPSKEISKAILTAIQRDLNPPLSYVVVKIILLQGMTAFVLLLFCPQLGVGPLLGRDLIMHLFMHFGPILCSIFCGAGFLGVGTMVSCMCLKKQELRIAYKNRLLGIPLLTALCLSGLMLAGGEVDQWMYIYWALGAITGSYLVLCTGSHLRLRFKIRVLKPN